MKCAVIFLLASVVVISHQQFQQQRGRLWMSPYLSHTVLSNYQPVYYDNGEDYSHMRYYRPSRPVSYLQDEDELNLNQGRIRILHENDVDFPDSVSRIKGLSINRPFVEEQSNARFFFVGSTLTNPFWKTATFTVTSTLNMTNVISCVPVTKFLANAPNCRKKREITFEDNQFPISPSKTQRLLPTMLPSSILNNRENQQHHPIYDEAGQDPRIVSSKDENSVISENSPLDENFRGKRFFWNNFVISTTVTTYVLVSTTLTKTINVIAADGALLCRPVGIVNC